MVDSIGFGQGLNNITINNNPLNTQNNTTSSPLISDQSGDKSNITPLQEGKALNSISLNDENNGPVKLKKGDKPDINISTSLASAEFTKNAIVGTPTFREGFHLSIHGSGTLPTGINFGSLSSIGNIDPLSPNSPLMQDIKLTGHTSVDISSEICKYLGVGVRGDIVAAGKTNGLTENMGDLAGVYKDAKALESKINSIESQIQSALEITNSQKFKDLMSLIQKPNLSVQDLSQIISLINDPEINQAIDTVEKSLNDINNVLNEANKILGNIGDGTRSISAAGALRGTVEAYLVAKTPRFKLGKEWGLKAGATAALIFPLPNPANQNTPFGEFKSLVSSIKGKVTLVTNGISELQGKISNLQSSINNASKFISDVKDAKNNPLGLISNPDKLTQLQQEATTTLNDINNISTNLDKAINDLDVKVQTQFEVYKSSLKPGVGIRDIGVEIDGPIGKQVYAKFGLGVLNPYVYLPGTKEVYTMVPGQNGGEPQLQKVSEESMNIGQEFYDPTLRGSAMFSFKILPWLGLDLGGYVEQSLTSNRTGVAGINNLNLGKGFHLGYNILNQDIQGGDPFQHIFTAGYKGLNLWYGGDKPFSPKESQSITAGAMLNIPF